MMLLQINVTALLVRHNAWVTPLTIELAQKAKNPELVAMLKKAYKQQQNLKELVLKKDHMEDDPKN